MYAEPFSGVRYPEPTRITSKIDHTPKPPKENSFPNADLQWPR